MRRTSEYFGLKYLVQCQADHPFFETIAAYNLDTVAHGYARDCRAANSHRSFEYRVMERDAKGKFFEIKPAKT